MKLLTFNCLVRASHGPADTLIRYGFGDGHGIRERYVCESCARAMQRIMAEKSPATQPFFDHFHLTPPAAWRIRSAC